MQFNSARNTRQFEHRTMALLTDNNSDEEEGLIGSRECFGGKLTNVLGNSISLDKLSLVTPSKKSRILLSKPNI